MEDNNFSMENVIEDLFDTKPVSEEDFTMEGYEDILNDEISSEIDFAVESISNLKDAEMLNLLVGMKLTALESDNDISEEGLKAAGNKIIAVILNIINKIRAAIANFIKKIKSNLSNNKRKIPKNITNKINSNVTISATKFNMTIDKFAEIISKRALDAINIKSDYFKNIATATTIEAVETSTNIFNEKIKSMDFNAKSIMYGSSMMEFISIDEYAKLAGGWETVNNTSASKQILGVINSLNKILKVYESGLKNMESEDSLSPIQKAVLAGSQNIMNFTISLISDLTKAEGVIRIAKNLVNLALDRKIEALEKSAKDDK